MYPSVCVAVRRTDARVWMRWLLLGCWATLNTKGVCGMTRSLLDGHIGVFVLVAVGRSVCLECFTPKFWFRVGVQSAKADTVVDPPPPPLALSANLCAPVRRSALLVPSCLPSYRPRSALLVFGPLCLDLLWGRLAHDCPDHRRSSPWASFFRIVFAVTPRSVVVTKNDRHFFIIASTPLHRSLCAGRSLVGDLPGDGRARAPRAFLRLVAAVAQGPPRSGHEHEGACIYT